MLASLIAAFVASAAPSSPAFASHVLQGEQMFGAGDLGGAAWNFRRAELLRETPEIAWNLAKVHQLLGDGPMEAYYYRLYLRRAPNAPDALEVAERLGELLMQAEADGRGLLEVEAPVPGSLKVDGREWVELPAALFLPPGDYEVEARFASAVVKRKVSILTGRASTVLLDPVVPPLLPAEGTPSFVSRNAGEKAPEVRAALHLSSMVIVGASIAALGAGTALGAMSGNDAGRLQSEKSALTVSEANALARSANEKGATANLLWGAGGAGLLAGGGLFVFTLPEPTR